MHKMSNLEYWVVVEELKPKILNKHLRKFKKMGEKSYRIRISDTDIIIELGIRLHETKRIEQVDIKDKFTEKVDKELDNKRLLAIDLINNDRIVRFSFDGYSLIFEMFGEGNVILVKNDICIAAQKYESWAGRKIAANEKYSPPSSAPLEKLEINDRYIIVNLMKLPLGKEYCMEILTKLSIAEKTATNSLSSDQVNAIEKEIDILKKQVTTFGFFEAGKIFDYAVAKLSKYSSLEAKEFNTLSEVCDLYYSSEFAMAADPEEEKLKKRLEKQLERLEELKKSENEEKMKGDMIYAHLQMVDELIMLAKKGAFSEIEKRGYQIDKKNKTIEIELEQNQ